MEYFATACAAEVSWTICNVLESAVSMQEVYVGIAARERSQSCVEKRIEKTSFLEWNL